MAIKSTRNNKGEKEIMKNILLITGCISPDKNAILLEVKDVNQRLEQYKNTLKWAMEETDFDIVIFCENSNYKYDFQKEIGNTKKVFEYLPFQGDFKKSNQYGKGYGEGEIIKYALQNSKYLKNSESFYKLTGRLQVKNINEVIRSTKKNKNYFLRNLFSKDSIDTRFYKIKTNDYIHYFYNAYENVRDKEGYALENVFYTIFHNTLKYSCFKKYPIMRGISGSTGITYHVKGIKLCIYKFLCLFRLYNSRLTVTLVLRIINKK